MNRKDRRAAKKHGKGGAPFPPQGLSPAPPAASLFAAAVQQFHSGDLPQAERLCRDVLTFDRNHFDALHLLGIIATRLGYHDAAIDILGNAIAVNGRSAECRFNLAQVLRAAGRLDDAAAHLAEAINLKRDYAAAQASLGDVVMQQNQPDDARMRYERALVLDPRLAAAHLGLANASMQLGRHDDAVANYRKILVLHPDNAEVCNNLGVVLASQGKPAEAEVQYRRALELRPDLVDVYRNLGRVLIAQGKIDEALTIARRALTTQETDEGKAFFVQCARALPSVPADADFRGLIARALAEAWTRPSDISALAAELLKSAEPAGACIARADAAWPARLTTAELFGAGGLSAIGSDRLLHALLVSAPVRDLAIERYLTSARRALLERALGPDAEDAADADTLGFFCALARQCFINEYVFTLTDDEARQIEDLQQRLAAAPASPPPLLLIAAAAYAPLHARPQADLLLQRPWPAALAPLIEQQVREPLEEQRLRAAIPAATPIDDPVSVLVRRQYEDMPYPRWVKTAPVGRPTTVDWYLRNQFPLAQMSSVGPPNGPDVLIAGSGTGQHTVETARRFVGARVLAIDLSLTSLGYARRKAAELGLTNIQFAQADILNLGALGASFDVIEVGGVLHHLGDPAAGWRVLAAMLRPGGVMHVGLYSELARADIRAVRAFIAERGYGQTAGDIRRCRQELMQFPDGTPARNVAKYEDFFTTSECRDLLFHVQEHHLTILAIRAMIEASDLSFIGFDGPAAQLYRQRFPEDAAMTDLDRWHQLEIENPLTFTGMYQFWVQRPAV